MKIRTLTALAVTAVLTGCASNPAHYAAGLDERDPKWDTPECKEIRMAALDFDQKIGQRVAIGLASGILLGPFGLPIAVAADMNQNERRRMFDREVHARCSSTPLPDKLKINSEKPADSYASLPRG